MSIYEIKQDMLNQTLHEPITGLLNRSYLERTLLAEMERANREHHSLAIVLIKLDDFEQTLRQCSTSTKNNFLKRIAAIITSHFRNYDHVYYFNEAEFLIVMPTVTQVAAEEKAGILRTVIKRLENEPFVITSSIGIAMYPKHGSDALYVLASAQHALQQAIISGGDKVVLATTKHMV